MYTGNVWGITLLIVGFLVTLIAFQLLLTALLPRRSDAALGTLRARPVAAGLVGLGAIFVLVVVAIVLGQLGGPGKFLSALVLAFASFPLVGGLATVSRFVGERMPSPADAGRPWRATLRGGATCGLAFVVPIVGWFLLLPASIVMGFGAVALSAFAPAAAPHAAPPLPTDAGAAA